MEKKRILLDDLKHKQVFQTPDRYFEELPMQIQAKINKPQREVLPLLTWTPRRTWLSLATLSLVAILIWLTYPVQQNSLGDETFNQISQTEILQYLQGQNLTHHDFVEIIPQAKDKNIDEEDNLMHQLDVSEEDILNKLDLKDVEGMI